MRKPRLSKLELQIMDVLWRRGPSAQAATAQAALRGAACAALGCK